MDPLSALAMGSVAALVVVLFFEWLARALRPDVPPAELGTDLYQGGDTVTVRKRRYLEYTHVFAALFTILHVSSFMLASYTAVVFAGDGDISEFNKTLAGYLAVVFATFGILVRRDWSLIT